MFYSCVLSPVTFRREYAGVQTFPVDRKHGDCSKALRNPQKVDLCVLAETQGRKVRPVAGLHRKLTATNRYDSTEVSILPSRRPLHVSTSSRPIHDITNGQPKLKTGSTQPLLTIATTHSTSYRSANTWIPTRNNVSSELIILNILG